MNFIGFIAVGLIVIHLGTYAAIRLTGWDWSNEL